MDLFKFIIISLHIAKVFSRSSRRKYTSSASDESIENLLYYKDCQHRRAEPLTTPEPKPPPEQLRQNACPNPKMCCSLSCDNECGGGNMMMAARQDGSSMGMGMQQVAPQAQARQFHLPPQQPMMSRTRGLKRQRLLPADMMPPIGTRRDFGFTKEKIKSLISRDGDIRKILRDLVRVTMQKVNLIDMLKTRRNGDTNGIGNGVGNEKSDENGGGGDENGGGGEEHGDEEHYHHHHKKDDYESDDDDDNLE